MNDNLPSTDIIGDKPAFKNNKKQVIATNIIVVKVPRSNEKGQLGTSVPLAAPQPERKRLTLKKIHNKQYNFLDTNIMEIFDFLLSAQMIEVSQFKCLH